MAGADEGNPHDCVDPSCREIFLSSITRRWPVS
jgi:hypothetical protein